MAFGRQGTHVTRSAERYFLDVVSGRRSGVDAAALRALLLAAEGPFRLAVGLRNHLYDHGYRTAVSLPRPTIGIGNLTTGGTGKTPMVCFLATALAAAGRHPAVLMRGYKSDDEPRLIERLISPAPVIPDADRARGAKAALEQHAGIDVFLLDDAMQHRRVRRDLEIVLISAVCPWGYGHVLPRGLLRESRSGLKRADVVVITHAAEAGDSALSEIESVVRRHNANAAVLRSRHVITSFLAGGAAVALADLPYFVACGIGQPESFAAQLARLGKNCVGTRFYPDHHAFSDEEITTLIQRAADAGAAAIVVTEKDWVKLAALQSVRDSAVAFWRARLEIRFEAGGAERLLKLVNQRLANSPSMAESSAAAPPARPEGSSTPPR